MSPSRRRPRRALPGRPLLIDQRAEDRSDGRWIVRPMSGAATQKQYRCPGCQQLITAGTPHLVVWAELTGVEDRRHWHTSCWRRRR